MESMSNAPFYVDGAKHRFGAKMGHETLVDGMLKDGLWDVYTDQHMGSCAEHCATKHSISRTEQDDFAIQSFKKAKQCNDDGTFDDEIVAIAVPQRKGDDKMVTNDEGCHKLDE